MFRKIKLQSRMRVYPIHHYIYVRFIAITALMIEDYKGIILNVS